MSEHTINLNWKKGDAPFTYDAYPRNHQIIFKNDETVTFSAAAAYKGDASVKQKLEFYATSRTRVS